MTFRRFLRTVTSRCSVGLCLAAALGLLGVPASAQTAPNFVVSYTLPTNLNTTVVPSGGTFQFPPTIIHTSIIATVVISNTGNAAGSVGSIVVPTGTPFDVVSRPLLPQTLQPNTSIAFGVRYAPSVVATDTSSLTMALGSTTFTATLSGSALLSSFAYAVVATAGDVPFVPNGTVSFPDTNIGAQSNLLIKVTNVSGATATISSITASGLFAVTNGPATPATLNANDLLTFTVTFSPTQPGSTTGKLRVGNDLFDLVGSGLGSKYTFAYGTGTQTTVQPGGTVIFSPTQVGQTTRVPFTLTNAGTQAGTIASIAVADTKGVYALLNPPQLPLTLNPGDVVTFTMAFVPSTTGFLTTTLQIDTNLFTLSGSGTPPPALPTYQFTGASGTVNPLQQPGIGLTLDAPYSLPLIGTLTLTINSAAFAADPSVQFATGGRTVAFSIPANTTQVVFANNSPLISLQSGTTAGTITLAATFTTQSGLELTVPSAPTLVLTVPAAAPQLLRLQVTNVTQVGFSVGVTGLSTTHSLSSLTFQFTPKGGGKTAQYVIDVSSAATLWYSGSASQPFGGQFAVTVPFTVPNPSTTTLATASIQSVSATITNAQGTSNSLSLAIQ